MLGRVLRAQDIPMGQGELAEPPSPSCKKQWCGFLGSEIKTSLHGADVKGERFLGVPCCRAVPRASGKPRGSREGSRVGVVAAETGTNPGIKEKGSALGFTAVFWASRAGWHCSVCREGGQARG